MNFLWVSHLGLLARLNFSICSNKYTRAVQFIIYDFKSRKQLIYGEGIALNIVKHLKSLGYTLGSDKTDLQYFRRVRVLPYTASLSFMYELLRLAYIYDGFFFFLKGTL